MIIISHRLLQTKLRPKPSLLLAISVMCPTRSPKNPQYSPMCPQKMLRPKPITASLRRMPRPIPCNSSPKNLEHTTVSRDQTEQHVVFAFLSCGSDAQPKPRLTRSHRPVLSLITSRDTYLTLSVWRRGSHLPWLARPPVVCVSVVCLRDVSVEGVGRGGWVGLTARGCAFATIAVFGSWRSAVNWYLTVHSFR